MSENLLTLLALLSPLFFVATALASWFQSGFKPKQIIIISKIATIVSLIIVFFGCYCVFQFGLLESDLIGINNLGFSIRLDSVSQLMLLMIALLSFIIVKFSINYLDGDQKQGAFIGRLSATIAAVQLLVLSGNLGMLLVSWVLTSISLHRLLVFYGDRPGARIAARKKFILARLGDACLIISIVLLYLQFGSGNLEFIFDALKNGVLKQESALYVEFTALFLVLAAVLKSAQFPVHGWLIEVMETPTPVSALLHAGLLNAGPFLIIRMAFVMEASTVAPIVLMIVGGFTAIFASVAYLTQTSVKTALGYSSVGHMGFSLMVCGLGVYPAAMLHLVAHSFYKAHSFLSSGSVIDLVKGAKVTNTIKPVHPLQIVLGIAMALSLYILFASIWGIDFEKELPLFMIGAVIVMGLSRLFISAFSNKWSLKLMIQVVFLAFLVTISFFILESATHYIVSSQVPDLIEINWTKIITGSVILVAFAIVVFIQIIIPSSTAKPFYKTMAIHFRNGLYANAIFDRMIDSLSYHSKETIPSITPKDRNSKLEKSELKILKEELA